MPLLWKFLATLSIIIILLIPLEIIQSSISERSQYRNQAVSSVAKSWTRNQIISQPVLVVPYQKAHISQVWNQQSTQTKTKITHSEHVAYFALAQADTQIDMTNSTLQRGIFDVPVYLAKVKMKATIDWSKVSELTRSSDISFTRKPYISVTLSDKRGIADKPIIIYQGSQVNVMSGSGFFANHDGFRFEVGSILSPEKGLLEEGLSEKDLLEEISIDFSVKSTESLSVLPTADFSLVTIKSDWPHPKFIGSFLPIKRTIDDQGFSANWSTNYFSSAIGNSLQLCASGECRDFNKLSHGVAQVAPIDTYVQSQRSIKYALFIILLVFTCLLSVEFIAKTPLHPAQYLMIGLSIAVFYLLLMALSEHIHFALAYLIATLSCVGLIIAYMKPHFSLKQTRGLAASLITLYLILYWIIQSEDYAFISGAILVFGSLAAFMMITRKLDWQQLNISLKTHKDKVLR
jgi:inner membrane protein